MHELHGFGIFGGNSYKMKRILFVVCLFLVGLLNAQSKKEQIEILNKRVDSLNEIVGSERKINLDKSNKISELTDSITKLVTEINSYFFRELFRKELEQAKRAGQMPNKALEKLIREYQEQALAEANRNYFSVAAVEDSIPLERNDGWYQNNEWIKFDSIPEGSAVKEAEISNDTYTLWVRISEENKKTVNIGTQTWTVENLNVSTFRNGDPIPEVKTNVEWEKAGKEGKPAWCYYDNDPKNGAKYGKLYNWYAVNDSRGLAPSGWHIATEKEWMLFTEFLGGDTLAGIKIKSSLDWNSITNHTNESGFTALPGGFRSENCSFYCIRECGYWWSSTEYDENFAGIRYLDNINKYANLNYSGYGKNYGLSVRCIKD